MQGRVRDGEAVLHLSHDLASGGHERVTVSLSNHLTERGYRVHLATWGPTPDDFFDGIVAPGVHRVRLARVPLTRAGARSSRSLRRIVGVPDLVRYLVRHRIRLVHAHGANAMRFAEVATQFVRSTNVIWHHHDGDTTRTLDAADQRAVRRTARTIVVAEPMLQWARTRLPVDPSCVVLLPNFSDLEVTDEPALDLPGTPGTRIVCLANLRREKDHIVLIHAMATIAAENEHAHLLLVGDLPDPEHAADIRAAIGRLGIEDRVTLLGSRRDVGAVLAASTIGVLASRYEGSPLALLEYGRFGLPVVATDVGDCAAILGHGTAGTVIASGDSVALARGVLAYLRDPLNARMAGNALRVRVAENYGPTPVLDRLETLYADVLSSTLS